MVSARSGRIARAHALAITGFACSRTTARRGASCAVARLRRCHRIHRVRARLGTGRPLASTIDVLYARHGRCDSACEAGWLSSRRVQGVSRVALHSTRAPMGERSIYGAGSESTIRRGRIARAAVRLAADV